MSGGDTQPHLGSCPCESGGSYAQCCGPLHLGAIAVTAETLMRSRYSAYVLGLSSYLLATWHANTRPANVDMESCGVRSQWLGLRVKRHVQADATHAVVEFVARYRVGGGGAQRLHEISRFVRENGRWYYLDGEFPTNETTG